MATSIWSRSLYRALRNADVGASEALRIARGFTGEFTYTSGYLLDWMVKNARRPVESPSVREINAARRADEAYCRAHDC